MSKKRGGLSSGWSLIGVVFKHGFCCTARAADSASISCLSLCAERAEVFEKTRHFPGTTLSARQRPLATLKELTGLTKL